MTSVLQPWVMDLPLRAQGCLLTGIRGCDLATKPQEPTIERQLVQFLRYCVMVPADPREVDIPNSFFRSQPPPATSWKASQLMHFPLHWYAHLMHCFEVIGFLMPPVLVLGDAVLPSGHELQPSRQAMLIYEKMAEALHLNVESRGQMMVRFLEDRIAAGTVVS